VKCPRCQAENEPSAARCATCGAPLVLPEDPELHAFDLELALDRRSRGELPVEEPDFAEAELVEAPLSEDRPESALIFSTDESTDESRETHLTCAPLDRRLLAWAVDGGIVAIAAALPVVAAVRGRGAPDLTGVVVPAALALVLLLGFAYGALAGALTGATIGQRLLGLRVAGPDGGVPGLGRSAVRAAVAVAGAATLGLGLLPAILTSSGRGLHDLVTGTVVVCAP
jgi:uncharacterized RDD family membrane protein YckC